MAGTGRRNKSRGVKDKNATTDRADLIKKLNAYYMVKRKKHGAKKVSLKFSNSKKTGYAGLYNYAKGKKNAVITVVLPAAKVWRDSENAGRGSPRAPTTSTLAEGKKIIRAELAHHVDVMENHGGKKPGRLKFLGVTIKKGRDPHGPSYKKAVDKIGERTGSPRKKKDLGPPRKRLGRNRRMFHNA